MSEAAPKPLDSENWRQRLGYPPLPEQLPPPPAAPPAPPRNAGVFQDDTIIRLMKEAEQRVSDRLLDRVVAHIADGLEKELRAGLPAKPPLGDDAIRALLKQLGADFDAAQKALEAAAQCLIKHQDGYHARLAHEAAMVAKQNADGLLGRVE